MTILQAVYNKDNRHLSHKLTEFRENVFDLVREHNKKTGLQISPSDIEKEIIINHHGTVKDIDLISEIHRSAIDVISLIRINEKIKDNPSVYLLLYLDDLEEDLIIQSNKKGSEDDK